MNKALSLSLSFAIASSLFAQSVQAANPNKLVNSVLPYACGGNETASYMQIPNSKRFPVVATLNDSNGGAGVFISLNNVPLSTLGFSITANDGNFFGNIYAVTNTLGTVPLTITGFTNTPKGAKGKFPGGGSAQFTADLTQQLPAGTLISGIYIFGVEPSVTPLVTYYDNFTYAGVPLVKNTVETASCAF